MQDGRASVKRSNFKTTSGKQISFKIVSAVVEDSEEEEEEGEGDNDYI